MGASPLARLLDYLCLAQLYLRDNTQLARPLCRDDLKPTPRGHWGTCPAVNVVFAELWDAWCDGGVEVVVGPGHAGASARAATWASGSLGQRYDTFSPDAAGLANLVIGFPNDLLGGEVTPMLPRSPYMGGQLGNALAFAQGMVLDRPETTVVAAIGDGECETGTTSAAWMARRAFVGGRHGRVLPVVLLNGRRMGDRSHLSDLSTVELRAYFRGLGYEPELIDPTAAPAGQLAAMLDDCPGLGDGGPQRVAVLIDVKGRGAPRCVGDRQILGTNRVHKLPLRQVLENQDEFEALRRWLASYRPAELFDATGAPRTRQHETRLPAPASQPQGDAVATPSVGRREPIAVLGQHRAVRLFCPDELESNRVTGLAPRPDGTVWWAEVLSEDVCMAWHLGYAATGRPSFVMTYEAFATVLLSSVLQAIKALLLTDPRSASVNLVVTSLGWHNSFTHQSGAIHTSLVATESARLRILSPLTKQRRLTYLQLMAESSGLCNVLVYDKWTELDEAGFMPPPSLSEPAVGVAHEPSVRGDHRLTVVAVGDLPFAHAREAINAVVALGHDVVRLVAVEQLTAIGSPKTWPLGMSTEQWGELMGDVPLLFVTACERGAVSILLESRRRTQPLREHDVVAFTPASTPADQDDAEERCGLTAKALSSHILRLASNSVTSKAVTNEGDAA